MQIYPAYLTYERVIKLTEIIMNILNESNENTLDLNSQKDAINKLVI